MNVWMFFECLSVYVCVYDERKQKLVTKSENVCMRMIAQVHV